jgi:hypothetical protein
MRLIPGANPKHKFGSKCTHPFYKIENQYREPQAPYSQHYIFFVPYESAIMLEARIKLECYIIFSCQGFPMSNTITYRSNSLVTKKKKCCEYGPRGKQLPLRLI